ncbi:unnamed protein product [Pleuronectes platessa]|uniref:Uncharacterized protein n=1 Tax=Pleuronectes platessa TaxID=8262 RepID=A0A9N7YI01_PLEPL|nr:unnamed protein product [Pleuronectes platessa]
MAHGKRLKRRSAPPCSPAFDSGALKMRGHEGCEDCLSPPDTANHVPPPLCLFSSFSSSRLLSCVAALWGGAALTPSPPQMCANQTVSAARGIATLPSSSLLPNAVEHRNKGGVDGGARSQKDRRERERDGGGG